MEVDNSLYSRYEGESSSIYMYMYVYIYIERSALFPNRRMLRRVRLEEYSRFVLIVGYRDVCFLKIEFRRILFSYCVCDTTGKKKLRGVVASVS